MKVAVFAIQYTVKYLGWGRDPIPPELRSGFRLPFFYELIRQIQNQKINFAVLPGGFFRCDSIAGIVNSLLHHPPKISVLVGRDDVSCKYREVLIIAPNGRLTKRIPEAWISLRKFSAERLSQTDRRFQLCNKMYAVFCCGDILLWAKQNRKAPTYSKAAFVLAHYTARRFASSMRWLGIPTFLSHHVKDPYNTVNYAYNGKYKRNRPKLIKEPWGEFQGLKWIARIYSI